MWAARQALTLPDNFSEKPLTKRTRFLASMNEQ